MGNKVCVTGCNGQLGAHLLELLLAKGYKVLGLHRRSSTTQTLWRIAHLINHPNLTLAHFDLNDIIIPLLNSFEPEALVHTAAMSHVGVSFENPLFTIDVTGKGTLSILEGIRYSKVPNCRMVFCASSEQFGNNYTLRDGERFQNEETPFSPNSPYSAAKLLSFNLCQIYRKSYGMDIRNAIMFNYESPLRGEEFVTRKITKYLGEYVAHYIKHNNFPSNLLLGCLDSKRDWTFCGDTADAVIRIMEAPNPKDYVVGSGKTHSVQEFLDLAYETVLERFPLPKQKFYDIDQKLFRPCEVPFLRADASLIRKELGWEPKVSFGELVRMMVTADLDRALDESL